MLVSDPKRESQVSKSTFPKQMKRFGLCHHSDASCWCLCTFASYAINKTIGAPRQ